jgi:protocatechuate 3,4-dioxygenase alpha subunit
VNPGAVDGRAPFFAAIVYARGLPDKLHTRIYLPDDEGLLAADPLLSSLPPEERATLVATRTPDGHLHHDIRLQGEKETVFLAF